MQSWLGVRLGVKCPIEDLLLLAFMARVRTGGRRCGSGAGDAAERKTSQQSFAEMDQQVTPRAHVVRLLLDPEHGRAVEVGIERGREMLGTQRVKLFHAHNGDILAVML